MAFVPVVPIRSSASNANQVCVSISSFTPLRLPRSRPVPIPQNRNRNNRNQRHSRYHYHQRTDGVCMQSVEVQTKEVVMPTLSSTMEEGKIVQWLKQPGDPVTSGEPIMVVESDKADMDVEAFEDGYLAAILIGEGESTPVGNTVALIVDSREDIDKVTIPPANGAPTSSEVVTDPIPVSTTSNGSADSTSDPSPAPSGIAKPDVFEIVMPALSSTMEQGKIVDWLKSEGDAVESGEMVMVVESDKADMDVEAFDSGILAHIAVQTGESAPVGSAVAYLAPTADDVDAVKAWASSSSSSTTAPAAPAPDDPTSAKQNGSAAIAAPTPIPIQTGKIVNEGRIIASPRAKVVARELGVDLRYVTGTGGNGKRICEKDVRKFSEENVKSTVPANGASPAATPHKSDKIVATPDAKKVAKKERIDLASVTGTGNFGRITADDVLRAAGKAPEPVGTKPSEQKPVEPISAPVKTENKQIEKIPAGSVAMNSLQKAVVNNMNASLSVPVFRITYEICTTKLDDLYAKLKPKGVTLSALLGKAVAFALSKHPIMNAAYENNSILYRDEINVAMAVSTAGGGLITPTLKNADQTDIYSLSRTWKDMVKRAGDKKLKPDEYSGGTFAISNLGMFGVQQFDAILPPGMPGILAVGAAKPTVRMMSNGMIGVEKVMNVTLTADHRHIYGADGAKFLKDLAKIIEGDVMQLLM